MEIKDFFIDESYLAAAIPNFIYRPSQMLMTERIDAAFSENQEIIIEAPTGSGKTISYLIPSIARKRKVIVATKTKQLMGQLTFKDIPALRKIFGESFSVGILKGRKNYFCPMRFYRFIMPNITSYPDVVEWFESRRQSEIAEIPWGLFEGEVCALMSADRFQCRQSKCAYNAECPFNIQKDRANEADVIITNHHLFLSDIALKSKGVPNSIFNFRDHAVFDEAHSVADTFASYAGSELALFNMILFFRENKERFSHNAAEKLSELYFKLLVRMNEGKNIYSNFRDGIKDVFNLSRRIIEDTSDDELSEEFGKYEEAFSEVDDDSSNSIKYIEKQDPHLNVKSVPFEIGEKFRAGLSRSVLSSLYISATISSGGDFGYFKKEIGIDKSDVATFQAPSVFDLKNQGKLYVPSAKELNSGNKLYIELLRNIKGSCLIICNSISKMNELNEVLLHARLKKKILTQNRVNVGNLDISEDVVLIGCASLREGVDFSGGNFRCVIIDKLPFEYYKDFFLENKAKKLESEGREPFMEFFLPRAVLYFNQAVGRLIRHESDKGVWAIFDERILTKNYGKYFIDVLKNVDTLRSLDDVIKFLGGVFDEQ